MRSHLVATMIAATVCVPGPTLILAPISSAADEPTIGSFGEQFDLYEGSSVQMWTVDTLRKSSDVLPYPVQGTLWEATATGAVTEGSALPIIPNFHARARNGDTYRVLFQVASSQGINPARLNAGQSSTGKMYFDATGDAPEAVVYDSASTDLLTWTHLEAGPSADAADISFTPPPTQRSSEEPPPISVNPATPVTPEIPVAPASADWEGTPVPSAREGTALAPSPGGTAPVATPSAGLTDSTPLAPAAPAPSWQATPVLPGAEGTQDVNNRNNP